MEENYYNRVRQERKVLEREREREYISMFIYKKIHVDAIKKRHLNPPIVSFVILLCVSFCDGQLLAVSNVRIYIHDSYYVQKKKAIHETIGLHVCTHAEL